MNAPGTQYLIRFDAGSCTQCHGCETACKSWRDLACGVRYRRVVNLWDGSYPSVKSMSLSLSCLHCVEPACLAVCPVEAISKSAADGRVLVDEGLCIGCRACAAACPYGVPQFGEDDIMRKCDLCFGQSPAGVAPPCVETCPGKALDLVEVDAAEKKAWEAAVAGLLARENPGGKAKAPRPRGPRAKKIRAAG